MYYLKIIKHPKLINFLFQAQSDAVEIYLKDIFSQNLPKVDKDLYKINPENVLYLDKVLEDFKNKFSPLLKSTLPPFSFMLSKEQIRNFPNLLLRAGKIYLEKSIKNEIDSALRNSKIFYKIKPWRDLFELVLPSTVDPKVEVFYKDLFWIGGKKTCFFCKLPWHESSKCPALSDPEPRNTFQSALNIPFKNLSQMLWEAISEGDFSFEKLKYLYLRNFYLLPEFLKLVFYRYDALETWGHFKLDIEAPIRGGNLGLGLEYLMKGNLESAQREFLKTEEDFRSSIGLILVSILKNDTKSALYYIEKALSQVNTPFLISYLLFLKGYIYEYTGEIAIAEEFYKDALEKDVTCLPAFYYQNLIKYQKGTSLSEILAYFNHPYFLYWSYLEPVFIRDQKELEELLYGKIAEKREQAVQRLKEAEDRYYKIKPFLSEEEIKEYEERLNKVRENAHHGGLGLIEISYKQALELDLEFQGYIYRFIKNLKNEFGKIKDSLKTLLSFWERYPYKHESPYFGKDLKTLSELVQRLEAKLKRRDPTDVLSSIVSEIDSCKSLVENLNHAKGDLVKKWNFKMKVANFLKTFSTLEFLIASLYIISPYLPISETLKSFFNFSSFFFVSFILLIFCLFVAYFKDYAVE